MFIYRVLNKNLKEKCGKVPGYLKKKKKKNKIFCSLCECENGDMILSDINQHPQMR